MSFEENFESDKKENNIQSSNWFKIKEGDNKMRIMAEPKIIIEKFKVGIYYEGCGYDEKFPNSSKSIKYLTWILDLSDNSLKLFKIPYKVAQQLVAFKRDGEYTFDDFPMPYNVNIKAENAGTTKAIYALIPSRKESPIDAEVLDAYRKMVIPESIISRMKLKQAQKDGVGQVETELDEIKYPEEEINPDDIPF